jgi:hypothetical protein
MLELEQLESRDCPSVAYSPVTRQSVENYAIASPLTLGVNRIVDFSIEINPANMRGISKQEIHQSIVNGFNAWASNANFTVREVSPTEFDNDNPIVHITDVYIDGPLDILGQSTVPGDTIIRNFSKKDQFVELDNSELWNYHLTADPVKDGLYFYKVVTHEIGHTLGMLHEEVTTISSLMNPFYTRSPNDITADDIEGIHALYGIGHGYVTALRDVVGIGTVDPATMTWYLATPGKGINSFRYGTPGWIPVVGDWNGDGVTTIGVFDPITATWYLKNDNNQGEPSYQPFAYGGPGWTPVVGDWDHNGTTTIGVVDPNMKWYLKNDISQGMSSYTPFVYGAVGWTPIGGTNSTFGVVNTVTGDWYLKDVPAPGAADIVFRYGDGRIPVGGNWSVNSPIVVAPDDSTWYAGVAVFKYGGHNWFYFVGGWEL